MVTAVKLTDYNATLVFMTRSSWDTIKSQWWRPIYTHCKVLNIRETLRLHNDRDDPIQIFTCRRKTRTQTVKAKDTRKFSHFVLFVHFELLCIPQINYSREKPRITMIITIYTFIATGFLLPGSKGTDDLAPLFNYCRVMSPVGHHLFGSFPVRWCRKAPRTS